MLRKSAAHHKKVDSAVRILQTTTGVKVPGAIILAGFSKSDSASEIALKQCKILHAKLGKNKTLREHQEKSKSIALDILERKGENPTMLTGTDLTALLAWHQHPKVAGMKKDAKFVAWMEIKRLRRAPPAFEK